MTCLIILRRSRRPFPTECDLSSKKGKTNPGDSNKRKIVSINDPIPKKVHKVVKHCTLCKKHGGAHSAHNMSDCRKYNKDCKLKRDLEGASVVAWPQIKQS